MNSCYRVIKNGDMNFSDEEVSIGIAGRREKPQMKNSPSPAATDRRKILEELECLKEEILQQAKAEVEGIKEKAYKEGYREGLEQGHREGLAKAQQECKSIKEEALLRLRTAEEEVEKYFRSSKTRLLELAGTMASKILGRELKTSGESLLELLKPLLQEYKQGGMVVIGCHKHRIRMCKENLFALKKINPDVEYVVIENPDVKEDQLLVEYQNQIIDLDIKNQIEGMVSELVKLEG